MTIAWRRSGPGRPVPAYAENLHLSELCTAELLLVTSLRLYAAHSRPDSRRDWRGGFLACRAGGSTVSAFEALFAIVAAAARRPLHVRCGHCGHLACDEGRLLQIVSLIQHGRMFAARDVLSEWLPPAAARLAIVPARGLASALAAAGLLVPAREIGFIDGQGMKPTHPGSALVH